MGPKYISSDYEANDSIKGKFMEICFLMEPVSVELHIWLSCICHKHTMLWSKEKKVIAISLLYYILCRPSGPVITQYPVYAINFKILLLKICTAITSPRSFPNHVILLFSM